MCKYRNAVEHIGRLPLGQRVLVDQVVSDGVASDQVFLNDAFENFRVTLTVPAAFGVNHGDGSADTDAQAIGFGAGDAALFGQAQFFEAVFKVVPSNQAAVLGAAFGLGLIATEKDVATNAVVAQGGGSALLGG